MSNHAASPIPPAAVEAAAKAIQDWIDPDAPVYAMASAMARSALQAAWPIIAAEIKAEIVRRLQLERGQYGAAMNAAIGIVQAVFAQSDEQSVLSDREALQAELVRLRTYIESLFETIYWMSGSSDFAPEGQAHQGWLKAQTEIEQARAALKGKGEE